MAPQRFSMKPNSIKTRFAYGFIKALKRLNKNKPKSSSSSSPKAIFRGYRRVKMAADASIASAVGSRRGWSRAMLWKIHRARSFRAFGRRKSSGGIRKRVLGRKAGKEIGFPRTDELRNLVPGGEAMDLYSLLDETAHYIKCLTTQRRKKGFRQERGFVKEIQVGVVVGAKIVEDFPAISPAQRRRCGGDLKLQATRGCPSRGFPTSDSQWDLLLGESGCVQGQRKQMKAVVLDLNPTWNEVVNLNVGKKPLEVFDQRKQW
ncbi:hypothetical protein U1Q18_020563 [Sarracenia purpurea var. burkii]